MAIAWVQDKGAIAFTTFQNRVNLSGNNIQFGGGQTLRLLQLDVAQLTNADFILA